MEQPLPGSLQWAMPAYAAACAPQAAAWDPAPNCAQLLAASEPPVAAAHQCAQLLEVFAAAAAAAATAVPAQSPAEALPTGCSNFLDAPSGGSAEGDRWEGAEGLALLLETELAAAALGAAIANHDCVPLDPESARRSELLAEALVADSGLFPELDVLARSSTSIPLDAQAQARAPLLPFSGSLAPAQQQARDMYSQHSMTGSNFSCSTVGGSSCASGSSGGHSDREQAAALPRCRGPAGAQPTPAPATPRTAAVLPFGGGVGMCCSQPMLIGTPSGAAVVSAPAAGFVAPAFSSTAMAGIEPSRFLSPAMPLQRPLMAGCFAQQAQPVVLTLGPAFVSAPVGDEGRLCEMQMQVSEVMYTLQCLRQQLGTV